MSEPARVLVVDDEEGIRTGCARILESEGFEVESAEDGVEGLSKLEHASFDLGLIDLMMPGIDGMELLNRIREKDPAMLTIVITGYATVETAVEAMKRGAYDYVPKPFTPDELLAVVNRAVELRRLRDETRQLREERERSLLEIAGERTKIRTIIACIADGVLVVNRDRQLVLWNPAAAQMLQFKGGKKPGLGLGEYTEYDKVESLMNNVVSDEDQCYSIISEEFETEGDTVLMANVAAVREENGEVLGAVAVIRDITELKEVDRIKSQFVSMVAHELRAPLGAVEGFLDLILSGAVDDKPDKQREMLRKSKERTHALIELVEDLLDISSIEAGRVARKKGTLSIADVISKVVDTVNFRAQEKHVDLETDLPEHLPQIEADRSDMQRVFTNLLVNAINYNREGGWVRIEATEEPGYITVKVRDNGLGIAEEDLPCIFDEFYRVDREECSGIPGTGLGLSIVKKLVDAHFGRIEVESQLNEGSTFTVILPSRQARQGRRERHRSKAYN
jgi:two-component system phosphate regulon sensor histidine kinase PhoR